MGKVRWGIVSTADIAQTQVIPAILRSENAEVAAISSRGDQARQVASKLNIPIYYESYEQMLHDDNIEAVYIPLPNHLHKQWVIEAARHGKHVLCEKPAALTVEETKEMVEACQKNNVKFMEAFMYQFHPQHERVQEIINSGEIGEVKFMRASFSFYLENKEGNIRMKKEMGGGSLYDVGCYGIHAIRNILKSEPTEIQVFAKKDDLSGVDMSSIIYMTLENGIPALVDCSFEMAFRNEYEIVGTKGRIQVPKAFRPDVDGEKGKIIIYSESIIRTEEPAGDQYRNQIEHFSQAIIEDFTPSYSVENTLKNMRVLDACIKSIESKDIVKL